MEARRLLLGQELWSIRRIRPNTHANDAPHVPLGPFEKTMNNPENLHTTFSSLNRPQQWPIRVRTSVLYIDLPEQEPGFVNFHKIFSNNSYKIITSKIHGSR
jgi:hypothetical protein